MFRVEIDKYVKRVLISKKRRKKYYHSIKQVKGKRLLEKIQKGLCKFEFHKGKDYLYDENGEKIIANSLSHGTENWVTINGQDNHLDRMMLGKVKLLMKEQLEQSFKDLVINKEDFPIKIVYDFHDVTKVNNTSYWDLDNRANIYKKVIQDIIRERMNFGDDNTLFVTSFEIKYTPIEVEEDRKLIVEILKDERVFIDNHLKQRENWNN